MCPIGADFKHFQPGEGSDSTALRNVSSIMRAKVLSIMAGGDAGLTSLFKRFRKAPR
jgi:ATP-dependent protease HslVU (ClpYQ) peptidase subunit